VNNIDYIEKINNNHNDIKQINSSIDFLNKQKEKITIENIINYINYGSQFNLSNLPEEHFNEYSFLGSILTNGLFIFKEDLNEKNLNMINTILHNSKNYHQDVAKHLFELDNSNFNSSELFNFQDLFIDIIEDIVRLNLSEEELLYFLFFYNQEDYFFSLFNLEYLLEDEFNITTNPDKGHSFNLFFDKIIKPSYFLIYSKDFDISFTAKTLSMMPKPIKVMPASFKKVDGFILNENTTEEEIEDKLLAIQKELLETSV
tara:strand:- start:15606 stop:16382 length:777 start_codon:yes stop_codon:yes gene_type:complete